MGLKGGLNGGLKGGLKAGLKGGLQGMNFIFFAFLTPLKRVAFSLLWGGEHRFKRGFKGA